MLAIQEPIIKKQIIEPVPIQETIYVLMRQNGDFLCARLARCHAAAWDRQIALALQGRTIGQLQRRVQALLNSIPDAKRSKPNIKEASLYVATLSLEPVSAISLPIGCPNIRRDFIRLIDGEGSVPSFESFSTKGRLATRPSKAVGFATAERAGDTAHQRVIQLACLEC